MHRLASLADLKRYRINNIVGDVEGMYDGRRKIAQTMNYLGKVRPKDPATQQAHMEYTVPRPLDTHTKPVSREL